MRNRRIEIAMSLTILALPSPGVAQPAETTIREGPMAKIVGDYELRDPKHVLTLTTKRGPDETARFVLQRLAHAADEIAAQKCRSGFQYVNDPALASMEVKTLHELRKAYVFVCTPAK